MVAPRRRVHLRVQALIEDVLQAAPSSQSVYVVCVSAVHPIYTAHRDRQTTNVMRVMVMAHTSYEALYFVFV